MSDLTRAIAEALGCVKERERFGMEQQPFCSEHEYPWLHDSDACPVPARIAAALAPLIEERVREARNEQALNIVFDGPPSHESGRFVEVETDDGRSVKAGEWVERKDGFWALRIEGVRRA